MATKETEKKKVVQAPTPTYTPIDPSLNSTYRIPTTPVSSHIVVSQADLMPRQQVQARQPIQVSGALAALQPKKETPKVDVTSPMSMTQTIYGVRDAVNRNSQQQSNEQQIPIAMLNNDPGMLMNKITPDAKLNNPINIGNNNRSAISKVGEVLSGIRSGATFGVGDWIEDKLANVTGLPKNERPDTGYSRGGEIVGSFLPGSKAGEVASIIAAPIKNKIGQISTRGALGGALYGTAREGAEAATGQNNQSLGQRGVDIAIDTGLGIGADLGLSAIGKGVSSLLSKLRSKGIPEAQIQEILALPMGQNADAIGLPLGREDAARAANAARTAVDETGTVTPEYTFGLPSPNVAEPTTARIARRVNPYREQFETLMKRAMERDNAGGFSPGREDLEVREMWSQMAGREAPSLEELIDLAYPAQRQISHNAVKNARANQQLRRAAGGDLPVRSINERYPQGAMANADGPITVPARASDIQPQAMESSRVSSSSRSTIQPKGALTSDAQSTKTSSTPSVQRTQEVVAKAQTKADSTPTETPLTRPNVDDTAIVRGSMDTPSSDTPSFVRTVKESDNASPELQRAISEAKITANRTTDQRNLELAEKLITRDGIESAADRIINKRGTLNAAENTAAQIMAKYYADTGQIERAVQIISKTAVSGRELGQAIQALTRWNKMSTEGALMMAERQLNRLTTKTEDWQKLTAEQAQPVADAAKKLESVQAAQKLAKDVTQMITSRAKGTPFTDEEKQLIQQFSEQIRKTSDEVQPLVSKQRAQSNKDIEEVSKIKPENRTRDQVQRLISAQADKARARLNRSRNKLSANPLDEWRDYIIIGADHITKNLVKFADWSEAMIKEGLSKNLGKAYTESVKKFRNDNGLPSSSDLETVINRALKGKGVDEETLNSLRAMASEIGFFADDVKLEMTKELQRTMRTIGASTLGEKIASFQTAEMLLSVPTFLRNTLGNWGQYGLEKIAKVAAVPIDWGFSKLTGERTIQFLPKNQEKYFRNFAVGSKAGWTGIDPQGQLGAYNLTPDVFKSDRNPFKWLVQLTGASLKGGDYASYMKAYGDVVATYAEQMGKANGLSKAQIKEQMPQLVKQLDDRIYDMADQAGLYATYQDETMLSKGALGLRKALNSPTNALFKSAREKLGLSPNASLEGFGLGDVVLKFAKTPANLVMRGIDYSPIGYVRGIYELMPLAAKAIGRKGAEFNQYQASRALGRATVGTLGLTGLGFIMAKNGILTGAASSNPNVRSLQEQTGQGAYKANLSALKRWLLSGLDDNAAKYQQGDVLMDYNWIQPAAISASMGVNLAEQLDKPDQPEKAIPSWKQYASAITGGLRTILENPLVTGLTNVVDAASNAVTNQDVSGFTNILKNVPTSFVPAIAGQVRSAQDVYQRETADQNPWVGMLNMIKNKIPGQSNNLPISYDSLGNERKRYNNVEPNTLGSYLNQLINPAKFSKYQVEPDAQLVLDVLEQTNDKGVLPKVGKKSLTYTNPETKKEQTVYLTNEEFSKLQQRMGSIVSQEIMKKEKFLSNPNASGDAKVKAIKKILSDAGSKARNEYRKEKGYPIKKE